MCASKYAPVMRLDAISRITYRCQRVPHGHAVAILLRECMIQRERAREYTGTHHHRHEARAFLVSPDGNFERRNRTHVIVIQRAQHFEARQHAIVAIELAARRLRIDMAARHHRRKIVTRARTAREDVADRIHAHGAADFLCPRDKKIAALLVELRQCETAHAALLRRADAREFHQTIPETRTVDAQSGLRRHIMSLHSRFLS